MCVGVGILNGVAMSQRGSFAEQPRQGISSMEMEEGAGNKNE